MRANTGVQHGFTLIELIAGIVVFGVALAIVTSLVASQSRRSIDPIWQVRAVELGHSLLNEISAKPFDENSDPLGGTTRCNEATPCTSSGQLGPDGAETRANFDDIDDYHGLDVESAAITNSLNETLQSPNGALYQGFRAQVSVFYDDNTDGFNDDDADGDGTPDSGNVIGNTKLIRIIITTPGGDAVPISLYAVNY
ncbi:type IV pilus modification PilV family protein [Alteromonas oceanisediminis]|uniref:type IV pilus modification PilV family protein n=1 Tax=Alteromonas oceanisediminis TaxID=2836180 RepID=UPI001BDA42A2|nr:prepilin-type N-terminal cleavage/methylation domain-containing protein [Alteromonas oceanisediminis]MBT0586877.1 prepilin-type N-terminal cleavage/methylation domain-containing protein [Alteromonas oceanisediminis]